MLSIFESQIFKRKAQEDVALKEAMREAVSEMGLRGGENRTRHSDRDAVRLLLDALDIREYRLEDDELRSQEEQLRDILTAEGILMRRIRLSGKWWKETFGPILGHDKQGNIVALLPSHWGTGYSFIDQNGRKTKVNSRVNSSQLSPDAICFTKPMPTEVNSVGRFLSYGLKSLPKSDILFLLIAGIAVLLFGMFTPFVNKLLFDTIIPSGMVGDLWPVAALLIGAAVGMALFRLTRDLMVVRLRDHFEVNMQHALVSRLFMLRPDFFWTHASGDLGMRVNSISTMCEFLNSSILGVFFTAFFSLGYLIQVFIYAHDLLPASVIVIALQLIFMAIYYVLGTKVQQRYLETRSKLSGMEYNLFAGVQKIKSTGSERRAFARWLKSYAAVARPHYNSFTWISIFGALTGMMSLVGFVIFFALTIKCHISMSDYIAFAAAFGAVNGSLMALSMLVPELVQVRPLLRLCKPIVESVPEHYPNMQKPERLSGSIDVTNLSFRYSPELPLVLNNFSLSVKPGEYIGIVGQSGCGKSTLLRLLLGFEQPQSGGIFYDQYDLQKVDKMTLRQNIGCCLQNGSLFIGDILQNITITAPWSTQDEAWEALRMASMEKEVRELPMGLHTIISEGGGGFSGGQKQRLLIARALINKPSIIFFDEATSALDNISQKAVSDNMDSLHCTRIIIAHRLSTIKNCDRIIVMDAGRVAEEGTFDELMARKGLFYEMSKRQL